MTLSIRARLTLWYAAIVIAILTAAGATMIGAQTRLGLSRLDDELERLAGGALTMVASEIDERGDLGLAADGATQEIEIKGRTLVILTADGRMLASNAAPAVAQAVASARPESHLSTIATPTGDARMIAANGEHAGKHYAIRVAAPLAQLTRERTALIEALTLGLSLAFVLAGIGGWLIGRLALQPLVAMAQETSAIDINRLGARITLPPGNDEIGRLGQAFNGLLARLDAAISTQRQFMADASHELRTPVSVTRAAAQVTLDREHRTEAEYRESLTIVAEQAARLTRMVEDMFLLARADAHTTPLDAATLYLDELAAECTRAVGILAARRNVRLRTIGDRDVAFVGDENLLRRLLINLLENAVAHTPPSGNVTIEMTSHADAVTIAVSDTGPGVPGSERERIFQRFVRLTPGDTRTGAGLGLPIARWIAERHGGRVTLESTAPAGARFVVWLPRASAPEQRVEGTSRQIEPIAQSPVAQQS
jgi:heavy metal sensor kinase